MSTNKKSNTGLIIGVIIGVVILGIGGIMVYRYISKENEEDEALKIKQAELDKLLQQQQSTPKGGGSGKSQSQIDAENKKIAELQAQIDKDKYDKAVASVKGSTSASDWFTKTYRDKLNAQLIPLAKTLLLWTSAKVNDLIIPAKIGKTHTLSFSAQSISEDILKNMKTIPDKAVFSQVAEAYKLKYGTSLQEDIKRMDNDVIPQVNSWLKGLKEYTLM